LGFKTNSYGLMIWISKLPHRFLSLCLKTMRTMICRLCHKTNGRVKTARVTYQDLAACFTWKQVGLEFPSLASGLVAARRWVVHVTPSRRSREDHIKDRRIDAMSCVGSCYPYFTVFDVLAARGILVFYLTI
jgi:hypothetical protein